MGFTISSTKRVEYLCWASVPWGLDLNAYDPVLTDEGVLKSECLSSCVHVALGLLKMLRSNNLERVMRVLCTICCNCVLF